MDSLNYHHLRYFWTVAREGSLVAAGKLLRLSHPTLSAQVHALEHQLGEKLFVRVGRRLVLTEVGRVVYRDAEEIFEPASSNPGRRRCSARCTGIRY
jgi:LysR family transcriptional regulator, transcriptional activator of nhaA